MKAIILNSGMGVRMGELTSEHPKCMTELFDETILSRQLKMLKNTGVKDVVITTGYFDKVLREYVNTLSLPLNITFIKNEEYRNTNYIYSLFLTKNCVRDDIILMHGDLVFEEDILRKALKSEKSVMVVSSTQPLPEKDFKAAMKDGRIREVSIHVFDNAVSAQPLYKLNREDWEIWLNNICKFCEKGDVHCYAENAFNEVSEQCKLYPLDVLNELCGEIDTQEDYGNILEKLRNYHAE